MPDRPTTRPSDDSGSSDGSATTPDRRDGRSPDRPARQTRPASSRRRQSWFGRGQRRVAEKDGLGVFLDDVTYVFGDVSILAIPVLSTVMLTGETDAWFGVKASALAAWTALVAVGALIRGGWVAPFATDVPGWVSITPWLLLFRLGYYNGALALGAYGGDAVSTAVSPLASVAFALGVGAVSAGLFPRFAESFYATVAG